MFRVGDEVIYVEAMENETLLIEGQKYIVDRIDWNKTNPGEQTQLGVINHKNQLILRYTFRFKLTIKEERRRKLKK